MAISLTPFRTILPDQFINYFVPCQMVLSGMFIKYACVNHPGNTWILSFGFIILFMTSAFLFICERLLNLANKRFMKHRTLLYNDRGEISRMHKIIASNLKPGDSLDKYNLFLKKSKCLYRDMLIYQQTLDKFSKSMSFSSIFGQPDNFFEPMEGFNSRLEAIETSFNGLNLEIPK